MEHTLIVEQAKAAKKASDQLANAGIEQRNAALFAIAEVLEKNIDSIVSANAKDLAKAANNPMLDRLILNEERIIAIADATRKIIDLPDILGNIDKMWQRQMA